MKVQIGGLQLNTAKDTLVLHFNIVPAILPVPYLCSSYYHR